MVNQYIRLNFEVYLGKETNHLINNKDKTLLNNALGEPIQSKFFPFN